MTNSENTEAECDVSAQLESLRAMHVALSNELRTQWNRDVPLGDLVGDRWGRAQRLGFGDGVSIYDSSYVFGDVKIGSKTWVGPFTVLDGSGGLTIGSFCSISAGVQIYSHETMEWALTGGRAGYVHAATVIGDSCYIGSQAIIRKGVTIGRQCVVGAGAFVNRDVPAQTIVAGCPARPIGRVADNGEGGVDLIYESRVTIGLGSEALNRRCG